MTQSCNSKAKQKTKDNQIIKNIQPYFSAIQFERTGGLKSKKRGKENL
jgi:hypothetical protein